MEIVLIKAIQLICCLSLLVFIHEGGHFLFAKFSGVKVEKFYLFFNPYFHLFSTRDKWFTSLFPYFKDNETEYGIGWLPLGGYVSIAGMVDETKSADDIAAKAPEASDFNQKPVWRRFLIMFGGVLFNLIAALVIYTAIVFAWGKEIVPMRNLPNGLNYNQIAHEIGFRNGDTPIRVDGEEIEGYSGALMMDISEASTVTVLRDGQEVDIEMPADGVSLLEMQKEPRFFSLPVKPIVGSVAEGMPAAQYGMKAGDKILEMDGVPTPDIADVTLELRRRLDIMSAEGCTHEDSVRARSLAVVLLRKDSSVPDTLAMSLGAEAKLGVMWDDTQLTAIPTEHQSFTFLQSIPAGFSLAWETLSDYVVSLKYLFNKEGVQQVGSFLTIGSLFPSVWDWHAFWSMTAFISIILAVMNILPIPGLDGGHIVLLLYEGIVGRQPSPKVMDVIERIGLFLLLALMVLAFSNDIVRFFF
ncbi:MAG: RIP metalloprotease RseP [Bacteroidaceae bacterium]|nr:RIP metalloprotease RseP [Bacteroidaceae bacterium]